MYRLNAWEANVCYKWIKWYVFVCVYLGSGDGGERVSGSKNRLVVQHGLLGHHWNPSHLSQLRRDLNPPKHYSVIFFSAIKHLINLHNIHVTTVRSKCSPFHTQALEVLSWKTPWEQEPVCTKKKKKKSQNQPSMCWLIKQWCTDQANNDILIKVLYTHSIPLCSLIMSGSFKDLV